MTPERIAELARERGFGDIAAELASLARPSLRLVDGDGSGATPQIAADHRMVGSFGDGGAIYFAIPAADLDAGRFDRVEALTQSG